MSESLSTKCHYGFHMDLPSIVGFKCPQEVQYDSFSLMKCRNTKYLNHHKIVIALLPLTDAEAIELDKNIRDTFWSDLIVMKQRMLG